MFIEIHGEFYNTDNIIRIKSLDGNLYIFYSNGESIIIYDIAEEEIESLTKILTNDNKRDGFEVPGEEIRTKHGSRKVSKSFKSRKRRRL